MLLSQRLAPGPDDRGPAVIPALPLPAPCRGYTPHEEVVMAKQQQAKQAPAGPDILSVSASDGTNLIPGLVLVAERKTFKSGKGGYWGQARWTIADKRYMVQLQVVEITNGD